MKAAIYNPYLDTLGGGERYSLFFAKALFNLGYETSIEWNDPEILQKAKKKFGQNFNFLKIIPDIKRGDGYDLIFWISDGSIPVLRARKNLIHFQIPFRNVNGTSLLNRMKLFRVDSIICNSLFTKKVIDKEFGIKSVLLYPPVDTSAIKPLKKENLILYVGRFSQLLQVKHQDVLIEIFKKMYKQGLKNWRLILAGGTDVGVGKSLDKLKKMSLNFPILFIENPAFKDLVKLYGRSKIFWSASGYDVDEKKEPEKMEHFGISVVEAMSAGCVPLVFSGGGYKEIINPGINGMLWTKKAEIAEETLKLIKDKKSYDNLSKNAVKFSKNYSDERFQNEIKEIIK